MHLIIACLGILNLIALLAVLFLLWPARAEVPVRSAGSADIPSPPPAPTMEPGLHRAATQDIHDSITAHEMAALQLEADGINRPPSHYD